MGDVIANMVRNSAPVPSAREAGMAQMRPAVPAAKRIGGAQSSRDVVLGVVEAMTSKRMRPAPGNVQSGLRATGGVFASEAAVIRSTGLAAVDMNPDRIITHTISARAFPRHHELAWDEGSILMSFRHESNLDELGVHTIVDPCIANYANELAAELEARARGAGMLRGAAAARGEADTKWAMAKLGALNAEEFRHKYNWLGGMANGTAGTVMHNANPDARRSAGGERVIGFNNFGRGFLKNIFADRPRYGEPIFLVVKKVDVSWHRGLITPDGSMVPGRAIGDGVSHALQLMGFSGTEAPANDTSCDDVADFLEGGGRAPRDSDADYMDMHARIACQVRHLDWADYDGVVDVEAPEDRRVAENEGVQEAVASTPELIYRQYREGWVYPIGYARSLKGVSPGVVARREALRDQIKMANLPKLECFLGL